jgi:hypothetical protein
VYDITEPLLNDSTPDESEISSDVLELAKALQSLGDDGIRDMVCSIHIGHSELLLTSIAR